MDILGVLNKKKAQAEGMIVGTIYKNPDLAMSLNIKSELFSYYEIYYTIFMLMMKKGVKVISKIEINTVLSENIHLQEDYKNIGGIKELEKLKSFGKEENLEVYEDQMIRCQVLINLRKAGFITDSEVKVFSKYPLDKIELEVNEKFNNCFSNVPGKVKGVSFMDGIRQNFKDADEGKKKGIPFLCPYLTERTMGRLTSELSILAAATNIGKSYVITTMCLIANIKLKIPMTIIANEERAI